MRNLTVRRFFYAFLRLLNAWLIGIFHQYVILVFVAISNTTDFVDIFVAFLIDQNLIVINPICLYPSNQLIN